MATPATVPHDFHDLLLSFGVPDEEYMVLPLDFLRRGQARLTEDAFLVLCEGLRASSPLGRQRGADQNYPGKQSTLVRNAGVAASSATRVVGQLAKLGLLRKSEAGIEFSAFWALFPIGKAKGAYMRVPQWLLVNFRELGLTTRDLRLLLILGSFYAPENTHPTLSGTQAGDMLGVDRAQAASDLDGLSTRAKLPQGFAVGSRTPRGYDLSGLRLVLGRASGLTQGSNEEPLAKAPVTAALTPADLEFFGTPAPVSEPVVQQGGPMRSVSNAKARTKLTPDRVHKELAKAIKSRISVFPEEHQVRILGIAHQVLRGESITPNQELSMYKDAAHLVKDEVSWSKKTTAAMLRAQLIRAFAVWATKPSVVAMIASIEFGSGLSEPEIFEIATTATSEEEVRAALRAKGFARVAASAAPTESSPQPQPPRDMFADAVERLLALPPLDLRRHGTED